MTLPNEYRWDLLASAIPTRSFAAAANSIERFEENSRNFNMETLRGVEPAWPAERISDRQKNWLHSDIRDIALPYVYTVFDTMLQKGELK